MKISLALACGLISAALSASGQQAPGASERADLVVRNVTLIDGTGSAGRPALSVVVRGSRVAAIVQAGAEPPADLTIDGQGLFAIPGLIDAHVHISGEPWPEITERLKRVLRGGVTTIFDMAGDIRDTSHLSRAARTGEIESPSIEYVALLAGPAFFTDRRVIAASRGYEPGQAPWNREINPQTDLVRAIAEATGAGPRALKLYAALDAPTVARIGEEARRQNIRLVAHSTVFPARPSDLIAAGVKMLAHSAYLVWEGSPPSADFPKRARGDFAGVPADGPVMRSLLVSMKEADVSLNPTLWIFAEGPARDDLAAVRTPWMNTVTRLAADFGVTLAAGTDSMIRDEDLLPMLHRELEAEVAAGLTPLQALVSATSGAAHAMGIEATRGTIEAGKNADLVLLGADPTVDVKNTQKIRFVIKNGRLAHQSGGGDSR